MQNIENKIVAKFKIYDKIVQLNDNCLYQLQHCPGKRTRQFKKLTYNHKRNAFYFNGQLIPKQRLLKLRITKPL